MSWRKGQPPSRTLAHPTSTIPSAFHNPSVWATACPARPSLNCPVTSVPISTATKIAMLPVKRWKSLSIIASRIPPAVQSRLRCANAPPTRPMPSASAIGACIEPGPFSLKTRTAGNATNKMKNTIITIGASIPSCPDWGYARLNEKFLLRNTTPIAIPMMNPTSPNTAFKSPAPKRKNIRSGHPKNINAPIITKKPNTKRVKGAEPPRGLNSFFISAMANAPTIRPMTSGRIY